MKLRQIQALNLKRGVPATLNDGTCVVWYVCSDEEHDGDAEARFCPATGVYILDPQESGSFILAEFDVQVHPQHPELTDYVRIIMHELALDEHTWARRQQIRLLYEALSANQALLAEAMNEMVRLEAAMRNFILQQDPVTAELVRRSELAMHGATHVDVEQDEGSGEVWVTIQYPPRHVKKGSRLNLN